MPALSPSPRARNLRRAAWGPPVKGLNKQAVPLAVPDDQAPILQNYLTDEVPGAISSRPGMTKNGVIKYIVYTGDQLPQNASPAFARTTSGAAPTTEEISPAGELHFVTPATTQLYWELAQSYMTNVTGTVFRCRVKVNAMTVAGNKGFGLFLDDGTKQCDLRIQQDGTAFFVDASGAQIGSSVAFSFATFHLIAVTMKDTAINFYLDDMTTPVLTNTATAATTSKRVLFGDPDNGSGTSDINVDYAEWWVGSDPSALGNTTTASIRNLYEYHKADGTLRLLALSADEMYSSTGDGNFGTAVKTGLNSSFESSLNTFKDLVWHTNGTDNIFTWDGTTATDRTGGSLASKGRYIIAHHGRLFHMGTTGDPSSIFFSEIDLAQNADPGNAANWPATNQFYAGRDDGDRITGPRVYNDALVVFKRNAIWVFRGYSPIPGQSNMQQVSVGIGCPNYRTAREWQGNLVFLANDGILRMLTPQWAVVKAPHAEENRTLTENIQQTQAVERSYSATTQTDFDTGTKTNVATDNVLGAVTLVQQAATDAIAVGSSGGGLPLDQRFATTLVAHKFTTDANAAREIDHVSAEFYISGVAAAAFPLNLFVQIHADNGGSPGVELSRTDTAGFTANGVRQGGIWYFVSQSAPILNASTSYWAVFRLTDGVGLFGGASPDENLFGPNMVANASFTIKTSTDAGATWSTAVSQWNGNDFGAGVHPRYEMSGGSGVGAALAGFSVTQKIRSFPLTGTWTSPVVDTGGNLSAWSSFIAEQTLSQGRDSSTTSATWYLRSATTIVGVATATYQSITPGSQVVSAVANRYVQVKVDLASTNGMATPRIDALSMFWFESGLPPMPPDSAVVNGRYYLSVASLGSTTNNKMIVLDRYGAIHEWTGWNYHSLVEYQRGLYGGSSTSTEVDRLLVGTSDNGTVFTTDWRTNETYLGVPDLVKWYKRILVTLKNQVGGDVTIGYSIDRGTFTTRTITTTGDLTVKQAELILPAGTRGKIIQVQVTTSTLNLSHQVFGVAVDYEPLPGRLT